MTPRSFDTLHMGRSSIDLYSNDVGVPFSEIKSFAAYVGGSPTNVCVGARRLGLKTALLTAVGDDPVGDFVLSFLQKEKVETRYIPRKPGHPTSAVLLGIESAESFPLVFYRDNCADIEITVDDVLAAPVRDTRVLQIAGTNLSKEPSRSSTIYAAELAKHSGATVVLDIDFRPNQWHDPRAFGVAIRSILPLVDIVIGTEDELNAALIVDPQALKVTHSQISDARVRGDTETAVKDLLSLGPKVLVQKRGAAGARVHQSAGEKIDVPGFKVDVYNVLGAGDAFAAGLLFGYCEGWDWYRAGRIGNACGAIVVTRHGCANFMPTYDEAIALANEQGGL